MSRKQPDALIAPTILGRTSEFILDRMHNCDPPLALEVCNFLEKKYRQCVSEDSLENLQRSVKRFYMSGEHACYASVIHKFLHKKLGSNQAIATFLGQKDQSSFSKMKSATARINGRHLTTVLTRFRHEILFPSTEQAVVAGLVEAITQIRNQIDHFPPSSSQQKLTPNLYASLITVLADKEWNESQVARDFQRLEHIAVRIMQETYGSADPSQSKAYVEHLNSLVRDWVDACLICLWAIADDIPNPDNRDGDNVL